MVRSRVCREPANAQEAGRGSRDDPNPDRPHRQGRRNSHPPTWLARSRWPPLEGQQRHLTGLPARISLAPAAQEVGRAVGPLDGAAANLADGQLRIVVAERTTDEVVSEQMGVAGTWSAGPRRQHGP